VEVAKQQAPTSKPGLQGRESLGKCPVCSRDVVEYPKSYGCTGYKEGCKFAIWKEISGKKITPTQAKLLLNQGKTGIIKGFLTKEKNKFDAVLVVREDGKIIFQ